MSASARKVESMQCLVISHNGDGDQLPPALTELGLVPIASGTGQEGANAIQRYKPVAIVLLYHSGSSKDIVALRAIQASCRQEQSSPVAVIVSDREQVAVVRRMLGPRNDPCKQKINVLACPPASHPVRALGDRLKPTLNALLSQHSG